MAKQPVRVVIADDHPIVRTGLQTTLNASPLVEIVGIVASFADLLSCLRETRADVVVLDLGGMGAAPISMVARLLREYPNIGYVIFSSSVDVAPELLQLGVQGYVVKDELEEHLVTAICAAQRRSQYLSPLVQQYVDRTHGVRAEHNLVPQEINVLRLMATMLGTQEIADELAIEPRTVQNYITSMYSKTGCHGRAQLVAWYHRHFPSSNQK